MKTCYIISDLHLNSRRSDIVQRFVSFIGQIANKDNELYILGDLFDYWLGDNSMSKFDLSIASVLRKAADDGLSVYLMHGNRDFLIGRHFASLSNVKLISDPYILCRKSRKFLLMHGDMLCTNDKIYQLFRKIVRNKLIKYLYLLLPLSLKLNFKQKIQYQSKMRNSHYKIIDVTLTGINKYIQNYPVLIHGHTHQQGTYKSEGYIRYVLGDWLKRANYIKINKFFF